MQSVLGTISHKVNSKHLSFSTKENAQKIAKLLKVPVAHVGTNDNFFTFTEEELEKAAESLSNKPIYINLLGQAPDDHADNSSMNTIGWSDEAWYDPTDKTLYSNAEVTEPTAVGKLERKDSKGRRELNFVSMSCDAIPVCSICGEDIRDCPHERGEEYDGVLCTAIGKDIEFQNYVVTNNPADREAEIGEVAIENASLNKRWNKMPKVTKKRKMLRAKQKAQDEVVEEVTEELPVNEEKEEKSIEDMLMAIQTQLNSWEDRFTDIENRLGVVETTEVVEEAPAEEIPVEEEVFEEDTAQNDIPSLEGEEEEYDEEEAQAGDAPIANPEKQEMPPKEVTPKETIPVEETPAVTAGEELPTDVPQVTGGEVPTEETDLPPIPDGTEVVNAPLPVEEGPKLKKKTVEEYSARKREKAYNQNNSQSDFPIGTIVKIVSDDRKFGGMAGKVINKSGSYDLIVKLSKTGEELEFDPVELEKATKETSARRTKFKLKEQARLTRVSNENLSLKKENAKLRAKETRAKMKIFAKKKMELIRKGFKEQATKAKTIGELELALEVANKSGYSARQAKYRCSDVPKYVDSRGAKTVEEAGKVEIDFSKRGGVYAALEKAAKLSKKK